MPPQSQPQPPVQQGPYGPYVPEAPFGPPAYTPPSLPDQQYEQPLTQSYHPPVQYPSPQPLQPQPLAPPPQPVATQPYPQPQMSPNPGYSPGGYPGPSSSYPYADRAPQPVPVRNRKKLLVIGIAAAALLVIGGAAIFLLRPSSSDKGGDTPTAKNPAAEQLFQSALDKAMSTKSYTIEQTNTDGDSLERRVDGSDVKNIRLSGAAISKSPTELELQGYSNLQNTYVSLTRAASLAAHPELANKWVQVRKAGDILDVNGTGGTAYNQLFSLSSILYQPVTWANLAQADRTSLLAFMNDKFMFRYDSGKATQVTLDGLPTMRYEVAVDAVAQREVFKKVAAIAKLKQSDIDGAIALAKADQTNTGSMTMYVQLATQRIVKIEEGNQKQTSIFSDFDTTAIGDAPTPEYEWDAYSKLLN